MTAMAIPSMPIRADSGHDGYPRIHPSKIEDPFGLLVRNIREYLGQSSGIDSDAVDPEHIMALMAKYTSNPKEWERYARADISRHYTRNLVDNVNGKANLVYHSGHPAPRSVLTGGIDPYCMEPSKGLAHPRSRKCPLHHEDTERQPNGNGLQYTRFKHSTTWTAGCQERDCVHCR
jgi:hypothetical protein